MAGPLVGATPVAADLPAGAGRGDARSSEAVAPAVEYRPEAGGCPVAARQAGGCRFAGGMATARPQEAGREDCRWMAGATEVVPLMAAEFRDVHRLEGEMGDCRRMAGATAASLQKDGARATAPQPGGGGFLEVYQSAESGRDVVFHLAGAKPAAERRSAPCRDAAKAPLGSVGPARPRAGGSGAL